MMDDIVWKFARLADIDDVDARKLRMFADMLIDSKNKEIQSLESKLYSARAQNEIYRGVVQDNY